MSGQIDLFQKDSEFVLGRPVVSIFHNPQNLFSIIKVKIQQTNTPYTEKEIIVSGYFPKLSLEEQYKFTGSVKNHPKYGVQFQAETFKKEVPETEQGVVHYLSSDLFNGIGRKTAETIVKKLGSDAIKKILEDPDALDGVPRLSDDKKDTIRSTLQMNLGLERVMIQLNDWGFGPQIGMRIYQAYREETIDILTKNPFQLIEEIDGIGFHRADELGSKLGITGSHPDRIKAAILHVLNQASLSEGHVFVDAKNLIPLVKQMLEASQREDIPVDSISQAAIELNEEGKVAGEETRLYLPSLYYSEVGIATKLETLIAEQETRDGFPSSEIRKALGDAEERLGVNYAETQIDAIEKSLNSSVMILTGGPGTGKTTVVRGLVEVYAELHGLSLDPKDYAKKKEPFPIILAAPTGRAAKRLSESTDLPAMTIHRLLGFNGQEREEETEKDIEGKLIIIDEMSMVDTWLAHQLLKAVPVDAQLIFVGDQDQLPPVGPGQVLRDMLASGRIPTVELTEIYRQSSGSSIIELAHQMKAGKLPDNIEAKTSDRSFIRAGADQIPLVVEKVVKSALAKGHTIKDIQVLAPMYKGPAGIDALNQMIQQMVNPNDDGSRKELVFGDITYRINDKVLQLVNQPESNVFNGDMGEVVAIMKAKETVEKQDLLVVSFDGIEVTYQRSDLNQLTLAYCCSIHKAQGSEFPTVIMPVVRGYMKMLRRNLLYTGITRSRDFLILCGDPGVFRYGVERTDDSSRLTTLADRLGIAAVPDEGAASDALDTSVQKAEPEAEAAGPKSLTQQNAHRIHPMIGMEGITPRDYTDHEGA
ncbi:ATP-dependent RecD-like DNA helicase [Planococcus sp. CP5-4]|uniref:SF1B family DNA helicase RecD2 n=1 Tax=unclassified Planococcus (in: firmicutes) TaxID=2662419 RepID=UPI001C23808A|nr:MULTISPECIES: ATP-dependent RecD-like DNA helicase [unclassified Planococcus (in: firmicutes)]MBU9672857.1 ATP-dependent RecD-like DNA helicase [Planococcus sp. CP5-4_YE]MBV0908629.1 ATP-dependent RecD-like DNA helicase [Planococcus sp. CP5-4_UN]MBW6063398.1 ATP-dependent RecD-like DNA helicase [Planococcus sp. CP5-4]